MKILAVDDDPIILELLDQFVAAIGEHELLTACSGFAALEMVAEHAADPFDCFLVDIQMPGMDGTDLVRNLRVIKKYAEAPVLMLTAMSEKGYVDQAFAAGATDYVTKPFEVTELRTRLSRMASLVEKRRGGEVIQMPTNGASQDDMGAPMRSFRLFDPIPVFDVDNVIDIAALENYVSQLSRGSLFGSTCFAFAIRNVQSHFQSLSPFEFSAMIADVAEVISDTLRGHQYLMSYAGNGVFLCVTESGWYPDMDQLKDSVNLALATTELYNNRGELLTLRVANGEAMRLVWKSGGSLLDTLAEAHDSAERAAVVYERELKNIWSTTQNAS